MREIRIALMILTLSLMIYATPGDLDGFFGTGGKVVTPLRASFDEANAVAIQTDGKIVVAGLSWNNSGTENDIALVRYNTDGTIDNSFGTNGIVITDIDTNERANAIKILSDGSILIAGSIESGLGRFVLAKYKPNGNFVTSFGTNGIVQTGVPNTTFADLSAEDMIIQPDGKILVAGALNTSAFGNTNFSFAVARYNADGSLDTTFGSQNGLQYISRGNISLAEAITLQSDGKILIVGESGTTGKSFMIVRLNADGTPDTSFDTFDNDGIVVDTIAGDDFAKAVRVLPSGKILVSGTFNTSSNSAGGIAIIRYKTDGDRDGTTSAVSFLNVGTSEKVSAMEIQSDGKILIVGSSSNGMGGLDFIVVRLNSDLSYDNSFRSGANKASWKTGESIWGTNGVARADFTGNTDLANAAVIDGAGRVVVAGYAFDGTNRNFGLARFLNLGPTAANATISGKVLSPKGRGISRTIVHLTDQNGNTKTARTNHFGYYRFDEIEVGQTVILNAYSKQYQFDTQVVNFSETLTKLNIYAQDENSLKK